MAAAPTMDMKAPVVQLPSFPTFASLLLYSRVVPFFSSFAVAAAAGTSASLVTKRACTLHTGFVRNKGASRGRAVIQRNSNQCCRGCNFSLLLLTLPPPLAFYLSGAICGEVGRVQFVAIFPAELLGAPSLPSFLSPSAPAMQ